MKVCPSCKRAYADETLTFCLDDGSILSTSYDPPATQRIPAPRITDQAPTEVLYPASEPSLQSTMAAPQPPFYSEKPPLQSSERRSHRTGLVLAVGILLGAILAVVITISFMLLGNNTATDHRSESNNPNANVIPASTSTPVISSNTALELPGEQWRECETYVGEICGVWIRESNGQWRGQWGGVRANLTITINGKNVTVERRELTSPLQATYHGILNAENTQITGTVDWCCDSLGNRSGKWRAEIINMQR